MNISRRHKNFYQFIPLLLLLSFVYCCLYLRSTPHTLIMDEVSYLFRFDKPIGGNSICGSSYVRSYSDVWASMLQHHISANGRIPIHFFIQLFCGVWGIDSFYIVNCGVFVTFVTLLMFLCIPIGQRNNYSLWIIGVSIILIAFPEQYWLWTSINVAPNYLWPITLTTAVFLIFERITAGHNLRFVFPIAIISFFTGWSHEGISVPLCGAFTIYLLMHRKSYPKQLLWLYIPLVLGTLALLSSPGNYGRYAGQTFKYAHRWYIFDIIYIITSQRTLILFFIVTALLYFINRVFLINYLKRNLLYITFAFMSIIFISLAHTGPRSMIAGSLAGFILLFKLIANLNIWHQYKKIQLGLSLILSTIFVFHQISIVKYTRIHEHQVKQTLSTWENSSDGTFIIPTSQKPWYVKYYVWDNDIFYNGPFKTIETIRFNTTKGFKPIEQ